MLLTRSSMQLLTESSMAQRPCPLRRSAAQWLEYLTSTGLCYGSDRMCAGCVSLAPSVFVEV